MNAFCSFKNQPIALQVFYLQSYGLNPIRLSDRPQNQDGRDDSDLSKNSDCVVFDVNFRPNASSNRLEP